MIEGFFNLRLDQYYLKYNRKNKSTLFVKDKYWQNHASFIDPDGKIRNLSLERQKKLIDLKNEITFIKSKFKNKKKKKIIDLGSGFGFFLSAFDNKWDKYGIELSETASEQSKNWSKIYNLDLQKKFNNKLIKKIGKFDVVFSYHVIEHLLYPEKFIENVYKILKPGGYFILGTPNFDSGCARRFKKNYRFFEDKTHVSLFSENSLFRFLNDFGFNVQNVEHPFFETIHFNTANFKKLYNNKKVSPPFYGNIIVKKKLNISLKNI